MELDDLIRKLTELSAEGYGSHRVVVYDEVWPTDIEGPRVTYVGPNVALTSDTQTDDYPEQAVLIN